MLESIINRFSDKFLSRWAVLAIDLGIVFFTIPIALILRFNFDLQGASIDLLLSQVGFTLAIYLIGFIAFKSYTGIIRHTGVQDALRILMASFLALLLGVAVSVVLDFVPVTGSVFSLSIFVITLFLALVSMIDSMI